MQKLFTTVILGCALVSASAASYGDATGEIDANVGNHPHLDISSVDVSNTGTTLSFKINLVGDPVATDWGKYMIGIDSVGGGDTAGNGWARPISMSSGMDFFLGGWADSGNGAEVRNWTGSAWNLQSATYGTNPDAISVSKDASSFAFTLDFAGLGLIPGSTFDFDVYSSGGGGTDSAVDAAGNPATSITTWNQPYDSGANVFSYTITAVPEPTILALLGMAGVMAFMRRRS
jgi:hypothetical protein